MAIVKRGVRNKARTQAAPPKLGIKKAEFDLHKKKEVGVLDLTLLLTISDDAINDNLHKRFMNGTIYTYIGHVLISVNPFEDLGIYTDQVLQLYKGRNRLEVPPHVFAIAEAMFYALKLYGDNQCVIISGESGAGKTEAAKRIMQYIALVSVDGANADITKIKDMVLATNPLLELFGCAKTLRNNNSLRHGKYLEIQFNAHNQPVAAHITNYLLEKQRIVLQITHERNFHIFYQFTKACPPEYQQQFGLQGPETYVYTLGAKCVDVDGIDDRRDFADTVQAMNVIGLQKPEQDQIFRMLAAILWIGNVLFVENDEGYAQVRDESVTNFVAYLLEVDPTILQKLITERIMQVQMGMKRGLTYHVPLNIVQATLVRDALAKGIYNNLFDWIVERVNVALAGAGGVAKLIGILDIYGFEIFDHNLFEQICINYVNEKLQQIFIQLTLKAEQDEYVAEQIKWTPIDYFNNKVVCDLIEAVRPPGLFAALNDLIKQAHADLAAADQVFAQRLLMVGAQNPHFEDRRGKFIIKHYAGDVTYELDGITEKNKDAMLRDLLELLLTLKNPFVTQQLFPPTLLAAVSDLKKQPPTALDKIKKLANALVDTLSQCQPLYIRTIKPNQTKRPKDYDNAQVLHQIKYLGLKENVRIRRAGFAYRTTFEKFVQRFYLLSPATGYAGDYIWQGDDITAVKEILRACKIPPSEYQLGTSKVFIKTPETLFGLEDMRDKYWHNMAARIQRAWRRYIRRKENAAITIQRAWRNKRHGHTEEEFRDYGTQLLGGRKERRRFSMLGSRLYQGDYLNCNDKKGGYGRFVVTQAGISEPVVFSARGEMLQLKFGRSSKRVPRIFVLTRLAFITVAEVAVEGRLRLQKEFSLPVGGLAYVALLTFQDNWIALSNRTFTATSPDVFINTVFKTELMAQLKRLNPGLDIKIGPTVQYQKKQGKYQTVKFMLGQGPEIPANGDYYKLATVHVLPGMPPNSRNPKRPRGKSQPVDYLKYYNRFGNLRPVTHPTPVRLQASHGYAQQAIPGYQTQDPAANQASYQTQDPGHQAGYQTQDPARQAQQAQPAYPQRLAIPHPSEMQHATPAHGVRKPPPPNPAAAAAAAAMGNRPTSPTLPKHKKAPPPPVKKKHPPKPPASLSSQGQHAQPAQPAHSAQHSAQQSQPAQSQPAQSQPAQHHAPPPPPPAAKPKHPQYVALFDYDGSVAGSLPLVKDTTYYVTQTNGPWGLTKPLDESREGWAPLNYLQEVTGALAPAPPSQSQLPVSQVTQLTAQTSLSGGLADALKQKKQEEVSLAGSLANALKKRQGATGDLDDDDDDDDDW